MITLRISQEMENGGKNILIRGSGKEVQNQSNRDT